MKEKIFNIYTTFLTFILLVCGFCFCLDIVSAEEENPYPDFVYNHDYPWLKPSVPACGEGTNINCHNSDSIWFSDDYDVSMEVNYDNTPRLRIYSQSYSSGLYNKDSLTYEHPNGLQVAEYDSSTCLYVDDSTCYKNVVIPVNGNNSFTITNLSNNMSGWGDLHGTTYFSKNNYYLARIIVASFDGFIVPAFTNYDYDPNNYTKDYVYNNINTNDLTEPWNYYFGNQEVGILPFKIKYNNSTIYISEIFIKFRYLWPANGYAPSYYSNYLTANLQAGGDFGLSDVYLLGFDIINSDNSELSLADSIVYKNEFNKPGSSSLSPSESNSCDSKSGLEFLTCSIGNFFGNFFSELVNKIVHLFVPESEEFKTLCMNHFNWFNNKLGFITFPFEFTIDLLTRFSNISDTGHYVLSWPNINVPLYDIPIINSGSFDFATLLENDTFSNFHTIYFTIVSGLLIFGFINLCRKQYNNFINGLGGVE